MLMLKSLKPAPFLKLNLKVIITQYKGLFTALLMLGTMLNTPASLACRMVTLVQMQPQTEVAQAVFLEDSRSLLRQSHPDEPYYQLAGQSLNTNMLGGVVPNSDGVGLLGFGPDGHLLSAYRQATPLYEKSGAYTAVVQKLAPQASVMMGHIRAKTQGEVTAQNNHPFRVKVSDAPGGTWAFMGNGSTKIARETYDRLVTDARLRAAASKAKSMTDTETLFHLLIQPVLDELAALNHHLDSPDLRARFAEHFASAYSRIQSDIPPGIYTPFGEGKGYAAFNAGGLIAPESRFLRYWPKTWVLSNGVTTFIMVHGYDQWVQAHRDAAGKVQGLVFASEPTNLKEYYLNGERFAAGVSRWQQLPMDTMVVVQRGDSGLRMEMFPVVFAQTQIPPFAPGSRIPLEALSPASGSAVPPTCSTC